MRHCIWDQPPSPLEYYPQPVPHVWVLLTIVVVEVLRGSMAVVLFEVMATGVGDGVGGGGVMPGVRKGVGGRVGKVVGVVMVVVGACDGGRLLGWRR